MKSRWCKHTGGNSMAQVLTIPETQSGINMRFLSGNEDSKVQRSSNYEEFELDPVHNRKVRQSHVIHLSKKIGKDGQITPIVVKINPINGKKIIHGGQHRFGACKLLGIPVRFIIQNEMEDEDMIKVHVNHLAYGWKDYLDHHISAGKEMYKKYAKLMVELSYPGDKAPITIGHDTLLGLLYWNPDGKNAHNFWDSNVKDPEKNHKLAFNEGELSFTNEQEMFVRRFMKNVDKLAPFIAPKHKTGVIRDKLLVVAIQRVWREVNWRRLRTRPESSFDGFVSLEDKLKQSSDWIERGHSVDDYIDQFEQILSYGKKRKNRVLFNV